MKGLAGEQGVVMLLFIGKEHTKFVLLKHIFYIVIFNMIFYLKANTVLVSPFSSLLVYVRYCIIT